MRAANAREHWKKLKHSTYPELPLSVQFDNATDRYLPESITISSGISIVGGLNGSTKSRTLAALADESSKSVRFVEPHALGAWIRNHLLARTDANEIGDEDGWVELEKDDVDEISHVIHREYSGVAWSTVEVEDSPFVDIVGESVIPLFRMSFGSHEYRTETMGLGELSFMIIHWVLWMLKEERSAPILIDEPDAYLSPPSRAALLRYLVAEAALGRPIVVSSHARELLETGANESVLQLLHGGRDEVKCETDAAVVASQVRRIFGEASQTRLVVFVEDEVAFRLFKTLVRAVDPALAASTDVFWVGGHADVTKLTEKIPKPSSFRGGVAFLGVVDGDQPQAVTKEDTKYWPVIALPGSQPPDVMIKSALPETSELFAMLVGCTKEEVDAVLVSIDGIDAHDWIEELVMKLQLTRNATLVALSRCVLEGTAGPTLVDEFQASLKQAGYMR